MINLYFTIFFNKFQPKNKQKISKGSKRTRRAACFLYLQYKKSKSKVAEEIGLSRASAYGWTNGALPSDVNLQKIADYFGVSPDSLVSAPIGTVDLQLFGTKSPSEEMKLTEEEKELLKIFRLIPEDMQKLYLEMGRAYANSLKKD